MTKHRRNQPSSAPEAPPNSSAGDELREPQGIVQAFFQHQHALRSYISRFLVSAHEIDDVSQETFLRAYKAEQKTAIDQPKAFLFRVAKNMMLTEFNNKSRKMIDYVEDFEQAQPPEAAASLEDTLMASQKIGLYCEAIAALPPRCRQVILMKKVYGMSHKEVARRMGVTISAVEKHLIKGGKKCADMMAEHYAEEGANSSVHKGGVASLSLVANRRSD